MPSFSSLDLKTVLLILGGLVVIWAVLFVYHKLVIMRGARETLDEAEAQERAGAEMVDADPDEFTWLDIDYYDQMQAELEAMGFRHVGDFENLTETRLHPYMRRFSRVMTGREGTVLAVVFMIRVIRRKMPLKYIWIPIGTKRVIAFTSTTEDGVRLYTTNTEGVSPKLDLPGLIMQEYPPDTPNTDMLSVHISTMGQILEHEPEMDFRAYRNREEVLQEQADEDEWMRSCDAYQKIAEASLVQVQEKTGLGEVGREMHEAYRRERARRRMMIEQMDTPGS